MRRRNKSKGWAPGWAPVWIKPLESLRQQGAPPGALILYMACCWRWNSKPGTGFDPCGHQPWTLADGALGMGWISRNTVAAVRDYLINAGFLTRKCNGRKPNMQYREATYTFTPCPTLGTSRAKHQEGVEVGSNIIKKQRRAGIDGNPDKGISIDSALLDKVGCDGYALDGESRTLETAVRFEAEQQAADEERQRQQQAAIEEHKRREAEELTARRERWRLAAEKQKADQEAAKLAEDARRLAMRSNLMSCIQSINTASFDEFDPGTLAGVWSDYDHKTFEAAVGNLLPEMRKKVRACIKNSPWEFETAAE